MSCLGFGKSQVKEPVFPFTNFVLKVDPTGSWESTVAKVLKKTKEVSNFRMYDNGHLQISGTLSPVLLLKVLGKSGKAAELVHWQFGGCSRNLHIPEYEHKRRVAEWLAYYDELYHRHGGGLGRGHRGHSYGDAYARGHSNAQYLPQGLPAYGDPRY